MKELAIGLERDGLLVFDKPVFDKNGWLANYRLRLVSDDMNVEINVDNPPYGQMLPDFFSDLANNWKGWDGEKTWQAMEDECRLEASMSKTGHLTLKTTLHLNQYRWRAKAEIVIEAGQLELIEKRVKAFFRYSV